MSKLDILWHSEKRKLGDLKDYERNPRVIATKQFKILLDNLKRNGYHGGITINLDNTIIGGHQRCGALKKLGYKDSDEIEVMVPDKLLSGEDFDRINIQDNLVYGDWNQEILANNFEAQQLIDWGFPEDMLGFDIDEIESEIMSDKFDDFAHACPKCGFEFDD